MRASISQEEEKFIRENGKRVVYSLMPIDKHDCDCFSLKQDWAERISKMPLDQRKGANSREFAFHCPRAKGKKKYQLFCGECGDLLGEVYADNDQLKNWCDLHYIVQSKIDKEESVVLDRYQRDYKNHKQGEVKLDKNGQPKTVSVFKEAGKWHGALAVNVDGEHPIIECSCLKRNSLKDFKIKNG